VEKYRFHFFNHLFFFNISFNQNNYAQRYETDSLVALVLVGFAHYQ